MVKNISESVRTLIKQLGEKLQIYDGLDYMYAYGMIQPYLYKNKLYIEELNHEIGRVNQDGFLLILEPFINLNVDDIIISGSKKYVVCRREYVEFLNKPMYIWATVRKIEE